MSLAASAERIAGEARSELTWLERQQGRGLEVRERIKWMRRYLRLYELLEQAEVDVERKVDAQLRARIEACVWEVMEADANRRDLWADRLEEGWEPFAATDNAVWLRRRKVMESP